MKDKPRMFQTTTGTIYKEHKSGWLCMTPEYWKNKPSRFKESIDLTKGEFISDNRAKELINTAWREFTPHWTHNGKKYKAIPIGDVKIKDIPVHYENGNEWLGYSLVMYNGQLKWAFIYTQYFPRVEFYDIDMETGSRKKTSIVIDDNGDVHTSMHGGWTSYYNLKLVFCITDKKIL